MRQEMDSFRTWFLEAFLGLTLSTQEQQALIETYETLTTHLSAQPQCLIHRDYHSRNLLVMNDQTPFQIGVIDFQDAMQGPFTYDLRLY